MCFYFRYGTADGFLDGEGQAGWWKKGCIGVVVEGREAGGAVV